MKAMSKKTESLILSNLDFVDAVAKKRIRYYSPVEMDDLVQAGRVGLVEAAKRFDSGKGVKFTTYAYNWILKYMIEEYLKARYVLHIPEKERRKITYGNKVKKRMEDEKGREPKYGELLEEISIEVGGSLREMEEVTRHIAMGELIYSLDRRVSDDSDATYADLIPDPDRIEDTLGDVLPEEMSEVLLTLEPVEKRVLEVRFGIGCAEETSLEELAKEFKVSRETIRRVEAIAIRKLRHPSRSRKLKSYLG